MATVKEAPAPPADVARTRRFPRAARLAPLAAPTLIVTSVLIALRGFAFGGLLSNQHSDILTFWLPRACFMGRSLAAGHVPLWNPHEMAGTPFAADAQSGWLYLPSMALSWLLPCGANLRAFIVLQPILSGLGLFWFLRRERLSRVAATAGGLSIAMVMSASNVAISLPFAGALAWTPFVLVGASGFLRSDGWLRRVPWLALGALAWGQVAAAHLSHGLVMCTGLTAAYVIARSVHDVEHGRASISRAAGLAVAFLAFLPLANLAILIPHFVLIERSSLRGGYAALGGTLARAAGIEDRPLPTRGIWAGWPFSIGATPGAYAGAAILLCVPAALRARGRRHLAFAFGGVAVAGYLLTLDLLVGAGWFRDLVLGLPFGDVYLHNPGRLRYLIVLVVPVLGALGLQSFLDRLPAGREAAWWIGGAAALFLGVPVAFGANQPRFLILALAVAATAPVLVALTRGRRWVVAALPAILAVDLLTGALWSSAYTGGTVYLGLEGEDHPGLGPQPLRWPTVEVGRFLDPGPIAERLGNDAPGDGRYLAWIPPAAYFNKGYLFTQSPEDRPALLLGRALLFGLEDTLGYSPIQLPRYWSYIRATDRLPVFYNASVLQLPDLADARLLQIRYLIQLRGLPPHVELGDGTQIPTLPGERIATERRYELVEVDGWQPRVSVVPRWIVEPSAVDALEAVLEPSFDPAAVAILERDPGIPAIGSGGPSSATYREPVPEEVVVDVEASAPSIVVVRNAWDEGWEATVDGRPAEVLLSDYFLQGVAVPAGSHQVRLVYREPSIATGLAASAVAWLVLAASAAVAFAVRLRRSPGQPRPDA